jgi:hypothetical protein
MEFFSSASEQWISSEMLAEAVLSYARRKASLR